MNDDPYHDRYKQDFWRKIGLDEDAALSAARCYPKFHLSGYGTPYQGIRWCNWAERQADEALTEAMSVYTSDARHPAFWYAQGFDEDEMTRRAVAANAMVKLQREAAPPPPQRDRVAEVTQALLMQGAIQQRLEGPDSSDDQDYHDPQPRGPAQPQEPFNPDDYPRFQTRPS